jgi:hypothetical protein
MQLQQALIIKNYTTVNGMHDIDEQYIVYTGI